MNQKNIKLIFFLLGLVFVFIYINENIFFIKLFLEQEFNEIIFIKVLIFSIGILVAIDSVRKKNLLLFITGILILIISVIWKKRGWGLFKFV